MILVLSTPFVQSKLAEIATNKINQQFNTSIIVKKLDLSLLGNVNLKGIEIRDHHKDTLIFVQSLKTSLINVKKIVDNEVDLGDITLRGVNFHMKKYKEEDEDNLAVFINTFDKDNDTIKSKTPFVLGTKNIYIDNLNFKLYDFDREVPLQYAAYNAGGNVQDFSVVGPNVYANIRGLFLKDNRKLYVTNLTTDFTYTKTQMLFKKLSLNTDNGSELKGELEFNYRRQDLAYFTDKVRLSAAFQKSELSVKDMKKFYSEISGNDKMFFTGNFNGTLNNFSTPNLNLYSKNGLFIKGDMGFVNVFNSERGFIFDGDLDKVSSDYNQLKSLLPNVLGKTLPTSFKRLGQFSLAGLIKLTPDFMDATLSMTSDVGNTYSDLQVTNIENIDNAVYSGEIEFIDLDLAKITGDEDLGEISLKADVSGKGFSVDNINSTIIGNVSKLNYKGYSYENLMVNGQFQNKKFDGYLKSNDENFKLEFTGLADFSNEVNKFDFSADIAKLDLRKTNLFDRDSIAIIKGDIKIDVVGNTLDNIVGKAAFKNLVYKNENKTFSFKDFQINSSLKDSIKTIEVNSKDIVQGKLEGKFSFEEVLPVFQNALGSVYTNYEPLQVDGNQFMKFDFTIYNQIVDVFLPEISIGNNTRIKGRVDANKNKVKFTFSSPNVNAYDNSIENIVLRIDNKNKLYSTHLTAKEVRNKYYDLGEINLLNRTVNDTLFFKSTFKGGSNLTENFNLDFFYTIDSNHESVIGMLKSSFNHNNYDWEINPKNDKNNKVTFNLTNNHFEFSPFELVSNEQKIEFQGSMLGDKQKDLKANFTNVQLLGILPETEDLTLSGLLNGKVSLKETEELIEPIADITVNDIIVNDFSQGTLKMKIEGDNSLNKYQVDISLRDYEFDNVNIAGGLDFSKRAAEIDLKVKFKEYELNGFSDFGGDVISNIRGRLSGNFTAKGPAINPAFRGGISLADAGLTFPYLNIDFDFIDNTDIRLFDQSFIIDKMVLEDTKYDTKGYLSGSITHQDFQKWYMKLDIDSENLLVLDTKEAEEVPYYGKGLINGNAQIRGLTSNLSINVNATTQPGTIFVIPLNDISTVNNYKLIRFKTEENSKSSEDLSLEKVKGLNLNFNLSVTKDAVAQVVIDKVSGSDLKGSGNGNLNIEIDTRGKFIMDGGITIEKGTYNFKYGGIISKPFTVQRGGTISWTGDPLNAQLDLTAIYQTKANPAQLLDNINSTRKIPIDLYTKITGGLFDSKQEFDIKIPNANSTVASELEFILNENDVNTKMQHFTFLMAFGTFYDEETIGSSASQGLTGTAAQVATSILSSVINNEDGKFQVGLGYVQGDRNNIDQLQNAIDDQVDVSVSTQISDRVLVNGRVGVPVGGNTQTSVVGEVKVEVLLNEEGTLRSTFFNKPNDVQFDIDNEGYTQGLGLSYQVNFNNISELGEKLGFKKKKKNIVEKKDSIIVKKKKLISFKTKQDSIKTKDEQKN
ncbi:translocation/assembly module TamB domain-containing protein [Tenacibaculum sp. SZ-18]|uniref:translocation/assembly module TamB domain-containing protein n=1 Tax=Tenacibaculum sp. SZ-18 TaxID=754423 RepID=UPI001E4793B9|nr:translocation/assembly module TamB domain-containing protein [Tenacibaculum sp. SZ-18]